MLLPVTPVPPAAPRPDRGLQPGPLVGRGVGLPAPLARSRLHARVPERLRSCRDERDPRAARPEEPVAYALPFLASGPRPPRASGVHGRHCALQGTHPSRPHEPALPAACR
jgi:hypothetical protein